MRLAAAIAVVAVAFSIAVYTHERHTWSTTSSTQSHVEGGYLTGTDTFSRMSHHPSWEDPFALLVAIGGVAVAAAIGVRGGPVRS